MSLPLTFHPDVHGEIDDAYRWYKGQRPGLGDDFLAAIEVVFRRIGNTPEVHAVIYRDVRRALPRRFPYAVYYRVQAGRVVVVAVQHTSRDPADWQTRV